MIRRSPILTGGTTMAAKLEVVTDPSVGGEESLPISD